MVAKQDLSINFRKMASVNIVLIQNLFLLFISIFNLFKEMMNDFLIWFLCGIGIASLFNVGKKQDKTCAQWKWMSKIQAN